MPIRSKRMWLAVAMLGANGNVFHFACTRMSKAFSIVSPQTVCGFLSIAKKKGLIKVVRDGSSYKEINGGKASLYQIAKEDDYSMIQHIIPEHSGNARPLPNDYNKQMFWEYLAEDPDLKWLGVTKGSKGNPMYTRGFFIAIESPSWSSLYIHIPYVSNGTYGTYQLWLISHHPNLQLSSIRNPSLLGFCSLPESTSGHEFL